MCNCRNSAIVLGWVILELLRLDTISKARINAVTIPCLRHNGGDIVVSALGVVSIVQVACIGLATQL